MLEAAKRLIQLGSRREEESEKQEKSGRKWEPEKSGSKEKRRSLVELVMSPSRMFTEEQLAERKEEEVEDDEERQEDEEVGGVRKFTSYTGGGRRRRRLSLRGRAQRSKSGGSHRSCPDLAALSRVGGNEQEDVNTMSLPRGEEKGRQSWLSKLRGKRGEEEEEEEVVDTVDTNTANVFGGANMKTQLIDINFE